MHRRGKDGDIFEAADRAVDPLFPRRNKGAACDNPPLECVNSDCHWQRRLTLENHVHVMILAEFTHCGTPPLAGMDVALTDDPRHVTRYILTQKEVQSC